MTRTERDKEKSNRATCDFNQKWSRNLTWIFPLMTSQSFSQFSGYCRSRYHHLEMQIGGVNRRRLLSQHTHFERENCCQGFSSHWENMKNKKKKKNNQIKYRKMCRKSSKCVKQFDESRIVANFWVFRRYMKSGISSTWYTCTYIYTDI